MWRSRFFLVLMAWIMVFVVCGCGRRLVATVQADAPSLPVPTGLSWAAVPGLAVARASDSAPQLPSDPPAIAAELSGLNRVAVPLAGALTLYDWKWISNPADADVLIRIWWETSGPEYVLDPSRPVYRDPLYNRPSSLFGVGMGAGWGRRGFHSRRSSFFDSRYGYGGYGYTEPAIQIIYARTLTIEALRASALPPAVRAALLAFMPTPADSSGMVSPPASATASVPSMPVSKNSPAVSVTALSKPPYAPALSVQTPASTAAQAPYAPPILDGDTIPAEAVLWRVVVTSTGSQENTRELLPQLAAAALPLAGKNAEANVTVDSELQVTYR